MGRISYLTRQDGRYYVQARLARHFASMAGRKLYRATLGTADYQQARQRLVESMSWVEHSGRPAPLPSVPEILPPAVVESLA
jgi:hypothetical protein